jgi:hypothetical protein
VVTLADLAFTGLPACLVWGFVHVMCLIACGNRLGTVYTWARALYLSKNSATHVPGAAARSRRRGARPHPG